MDWRATILFRIFLLDLVVPFIRKIQCVARLALLTF
jgi:hypothetical protein